MTQHLHNQDTSTIRTPPQSGHLHLLPIEIVRCSIVASANVHVCHNVSILPSSPPPSTSLPLSPSPPSPLPLPLPTQDTVAAVFQDCDYPTLSRNKNLESFKKRCTCGVWGMGEWRYGVWGMGEWRYGVWGYARTSTCINNSRYIVHV